MLYYGKPTYPIQFTFSPNASGAYTNGYKDWTDTTYKMPFVSLMADNLVVFEGLMYIGTAQASAFTLPANLRPAKNIVFSTPTGSHGETVVYVGSDGTIKPQVNAPGDWVSLSGISYYLI